MVDSNSAHGDIRNAMPAPSRVRLCLFFFFFSISADAAQSLDVRGVNVGSKITENYLPFAIAGNPANQSRLF